MTANSSWKRNRMNLENIDFFAFEYIFDTSLHIVEILKLRRKIYVLG